MLKVAELKRTGSMFSDLTIAPNGRTLRAVEFTAAGEANLFQWNLDTDRSAAAVCDLETPRMTMAEWRRYFVELPYQPPCP